MESDSNNHDSKIQYRFGRRYTDVMQINQLIIYHTKIIRKITSPVHTSSTYFSSTLYYKVYKVSKVSK